MTGTVTAFDDPVGLGTITGDDGREYPFHCTQILDGTRTVDVGTAVTFDVKPWHLGRYEAVEISPVRRTP